MRLAYQILSDVSYVLLSLQANATLTGPVGAPGTVTVGVSNVNAMYVGAQVIVGTGVDQEQVTLTAVGTTTITAVFANAHASGEAVFAPTFPEGYPDGQLFTQGELLQYLANVQNELLLRVRPIFAQATVDLTTGLPTAPAPSDAIRVERISHVNVNNGVDALWNVSEPELDFSNPYWSQDKGTPLEWFQDGSLLASALTQPNIGFHPVTQINDTVTAYYSQCGSDTLTLLSAMLVPDVMAHFLKYGVLERCFGKDGEQKDPFRENYCRKRFEFGCFWAANFVNLVDHVAAKNGEMPPFTPLQIAPERGANALATR